MYEDVIREIKDSVSILDVVSQYVRLERATADEYRGLCPFHNEKHPSFYVNPEKGLYYCFGCGASGDVITFLMNIENITFVEAVKKLAEMAGIPLEQNADTGKRKRLLDLMGFATTFYQKALYDKRNESALQYLRSGRRLSDGAIGLFKLGYAPKANVLLQAAKSNGFTQDELIESGLGVIYKDKYYDRFIGRITIPIFNTNSVIIGMAGRILPENDNGKRQKYINAPDSLLYRKGLTLYNLNNAKDAIKETKRVILVEGYFDAISVYSANIRNVVATCGTALTPQQANLLKRYNAETVVIAFDGDNGGFTGIKRIAMPLFASNIFVRVAWFKEGNDPDNIIKRDVEGFKKAIEYAKPFIRFIVSKDSRFTEKTTKPEDRRSATLELLRYTKVVDSPTLKEILLRQISRASGFRFETLMEALEKEVK